jgi:RNA polymerase subunit RPABC4/transcription elongation factor Spt4
MHLLITLAVFAAAYWVYNDAKSNGNEKTTIILWTLGTLLMMVIVLPLYLLFGRKPIMKSKREEQIIDVEATPVDDKEKINCPMCANKVQEDFKICPYCGYTLKPKCKECGQELNREWRVCPYCQTPTAEK